MTPRLFELHEHEANVKETCGTDPLIDHSVSPIDRSYVSASIRGHVLGVPTVTDEKQTGHRSCRHVEGVEMWEMVVRL